MITVNAPEALAEIEAASNAYEAALCSGDIEALVDAFWRSDDAVRIGDDEELFGWAQIAEFRRRDAAAPVNRLVRRRVVTAFGSDIATVQLVAEYPEDHRIGRQTQLWVRTEAGWRIAQAHVSWPLRSIRTHLPDQRRDRQ